MRILHFLSTPSAGGAEVYVRDLAAAMVARGHQVHVAFLGHAVDVGRSAQYENGFLSILKRNGVKYSFVGNECRRRPWLGVRRISKMVTEIEADVYHTHLMHGILYGFGVKAPRIYTHHNIIPKAGRVAYSLFNRLVDQYVGISDLCSDRLQTFTGKSVETIFNGADPAKFHLSSSVAADRVNAIAVGGICRQKNYRMMVEAIGGLSEDILQFFELRICGEGSPAETEELRRQIVEKGLQDNVILLGNRDDIPKLLGESSLFLMSSEWEGLPIALIEACMSGLPILATDVGGCSEIVATCENGIVVPPGDAPAMTHELSKLIADRKRRLSLAANANRLKHAYSIDKACESHLQLYERLSCRD